MVPWDTVFVTRSVTKNGVITAQTYKDAQLVLCAVITSVIISMNARSTVRLWTSTRPRYWPSRKRQLVNKQNLKGYNMKKYRRNKWSKNILRWPYQRLRLQRMLMHLIKFD